MLVARSCGSHATAVGGYGLLRARYAAMWSSLVLLALLASAQGRAVNISNTWVLPEEGFPVFYRYFRDRISWYEADAVCQFHHANLVTVDTTSQYDAVRAYLKELDILSAVWIGLIRSNPDGDFTWTDYRGLSGDGYWSSAPDSRSAPLCAAANPAADYRWESRGCGGPTVASFICELPVPQWALGNQGCMVRELPALTVLYLPESAAVQLNADCGLAGVRRVQCTGNVKREGLLKDLSCVEEDDISNTSMTTGNNWHSTTDPADLDTTSDVTTEENMTIEHGSDINQPMVITATSLPQYIKSKLQYRSPTKFINVGDFNSIVKDDHNIHSNYIAKNIDEDNILTNEQLEKLEDERHMQHKMLHEEIARVGNIDNIFTQPTDHFIPPLVMAKSRMSDDMTVLSLAEKHAQQLAERHFNKHNNDDNSVEVKRLPTEDLHADKLLITPTKIMRIKENKKDILKSHVPKKYISVKYNDSKRKNYLDIKSVSLDKSTQTPPLPNLNLEANRSTTSANHVYYHDKIDEDFAMDLSVMLKDAPLTSEEQEPALSYSGDMATLDAVMNKSVSITNEEKGGSSTSVKPDLDVSPIISKSKTTTIPDTTVIGDTTLVHEVVKITLISMEPSVNTTVFEITTKMPIFKDDAIEVHSTYSTDVPKTTSKETQTMESAKDPSEYSSQANFEVSNSTPEATTKVLQTTVGTKYSISENITTEYVYSTTEITNAKTTLNTNMPLFRNKSEVTDLTTTMNPTAFTSINNDYNQVTINITDKNGIDNITNNHNDSTSTESFEKLDLNDTEIHDLLEKNATDTEEAIDDNSPLLSGAYEPVQRPPRTRRPQQQNRKFNPFRILG